MSLSAVFDVYPAGVAPLGAARVHAVCRLFSLPGGIFWIPLRSGLPHADTDLTLTSGETIAV